MPHFPTAGPSAAQRRPAGAAASTWLKCLQCGAQLTEISVRRGRTGIEICALGAVLWVDRAEIACPQCGAVRRFTGVEAPAGQGPDECHLPARTLGRSA